LDDRLGLVWSQPNAVHSGNLIALLLETAFKKSADGFWPSWDIR